MPWPWTDPETANIIAACAFGVSTFSAIANAWWTNHKTKEKWMPYIDIYILKKFVGHQRPGTQFEAKINNANSSGQVTIQKVVVTNLFFGHRFFFFIGNKAHSFMGNKAYFLPKNTSIFCAGKNTEERIENFCATIDAETPIWEKPFSIEPKTIVETFYTIEVAPDLPDLDPSDYALVFYFSRGDNKQGYLIKPLPKQFKPK